MKLAFLIGCAFLLPGCALLDSQAPKKPAPTGLIATPPSYYSTAKAKYLAARYKDNLDRMIERIVRNPKTSSLQFANNISSVGGIGFFTHSATKTPDERYLELVLATPETFEAKTEVSAKVHQLFSRYGMELLGIVSGDADIYRDKELSGYGLNLAWRNVIEEPAGNRIAMARAIVYFPKERVLSFLRNEVSQNDLLAEAVMFAVEEDGPLNLVSYKAQALRPELRPAIREDDLTSSPVAALPPQPREAARKTEERPKVEQSIEAAKIETSSITAAAKPSQQEIKAQAKAVAGAQKSAAKAPVAKKAADETLQPSPVPQRQDSQQAVASNEVTRELPSETSVAEAKTEASGTTGPVVVKPSVPAALESTAQHVIAEPAPFSESKVSGVTPKMSSEPATASASQLVKPAKNLPVVSKTAAEPAKSIPVAAEALKIPAALPATETKLVEPQEDFAGKPAEKQLAVALTKEEAKAAQVAPLTLSNTEAPALAARLDTPPVQTKSEKIEASERKMAPPPIEKSSERKHEPESSSIAAKPQEAPSPRTVRSETARVEAKPAAPQNAAKPQVIEAPRSEALALNRSAELIPQKTAPGAPRTEATAVQTKPGAALVEVKSRGIVSEAPKNEGAAPVSKASEPVAEKMVAARQALPSEPASTAPAPSAARAEPTPVEIKPTLPASRGKEIVAEKSAGEQVALLSKPKDPMIEKKPALAPPAQKALEGFIIQLAFNDKDKARHWAEAMQRRGYAVSVTEAGADGALRVRLGNFVAREDAERQLRSLKQDGLTGIIINLPQAFRPEARSSVP